MSLIATKMRKLAEAKSRRTPWDWSDRAARARLVGPVRRDPTPHVVIRTPEGKDVTKNATYQNRLYREAKSLRERIPGILLTRTESMKPTGENVRKCMRSEASREGQAIVRRHNDIMMALGAHAQERDSSQFRRGR